MANKEIKKRGREINSALIKYGFGKFVNRSIKNKILPSKEEDEYSILLDPELPVNLRLMFQELGTAFIKLGQLLSTRPDMVGENIATEFEKLQDDNPPITYEEVKSIVESELNGSIEDLFAEFSKEPLATASIGQVHQARLNTGEKVAVKVQKGGIAETIDTDLIIMKHLAEKLHNNDELRKFNIPGIMDAFDHSIHIEIDYINELIHMKQLERNFAADDTVHIPAAYTQYCSSKVLTMEFIEGTKMQDVIDSTGDEFDKPLLAKRILDSFMKQLLVDGFFHDDPHAGNIFILDDDVICYIDLGTVGILDEDFKKELLELLIMVADKDVKGVINQFVYMGVLDYTMDTTDLKRDLRDLFFRAFNEESGGINDILDKLLGLMQEYGIILPNEFATMARSLSMIESVTSSLDPNADMMASIEPIAKGTVKEKLSVKNFIDDKKGSLLYYKNMLKSLLPLLANSIHKIENGDMSIRFELDSLDRIVSKFSLVVLIAALLISSSLVMTITRGPMLFDMPLLAVIGYIIAAILSILSIINYLYGR
ncbi:ABC1 kinase family protein [Methanobrevibacter sp.]